MNAKKILSAKILLVPINVFAKKDLKETNYFAMVTKNFIQVAILDIAKII
jgi:hypothetical protein